MTTYIYEPLDYSQAQIRLLKLHQTPNYSDPIRISLQEVIIPQSCLNTSLEAGIEAMNLASKNSDVEKPDFVALSYVWGSPDDPAEVVVEPAPDGANTISITRNLDVALRHFRQMITESIVIWIDAICIDQGNLEERGHQVAMMDSIYTIARKAIVWLGPKSHDSHLAMKLLRYLGERVSYRDAELKRHPDAPPRTPNEGFLESDTEHIPFSLDELRAIISFLERAWFTRLWIRQEIVLATRADVVCGTRKIDWVHLQNGAACFCGKPLPIHPTEPIPKRFARMKPAVMGLIHNSLSGTSYEDLRRDFEGVRVTDPRDTIYAIKSLLTEDDQQLDVRPNYNSQTADVFLDVCVRIVERQGLTYFLESCELTSISVPSLPSWVPDWSKSLTAPRSIENFWSASAFISANATYLGDGVLRVAGIHIDRIESVRNLYDPVDNEPDCDWRQTSFEKVFRYVQDWYPWDPSIDSPYDENQSILDAYCRTVNAGRFSDDAKVALKRILGLDADWTRPERLQEDDQVHQFLHAYLRYTRSRCFFTTESGWIGLAPLGTQPGDIIGIILGCQVPIILRNDPTSSAKPNENRWEVVGPSYVNGLMSGEAVYGILPSHCRAVHHNSRVRDAKLIRGRRNAILDTWTNELKTDPAAILEEFGVQPSVWTRNPHRLEVSETALREAGVELRDFFLV